jgi:cytidylate kinase
MIEALSRYTIAIDGPSGVGKSTVSRLLADKLNAHYVDTGAMYRAVAIGLDEAGVDVHDGEQLMEYLKAVNLVFDGGLVLLNDVDFTERIREPGVGALASKYSASTLVRGRLVFIQRKLAASASKLVMEGRDIGTVVLPEADMKFFLDASVDVRAKRRHADEKNLVDLSLEDIEDELNERDTRDTTREDSPLKMADDAVRIDTGLLTIDEVLSEMMRMIEERGL